MTERSEIEAWRELVHLYMERVLKFEAAQKRLREEEGQEWQGQPQLPPEYWRVTVAEES